jgi:hypothetical protein
MTSTLRRTVDIPADRRLYVELPPDMPIGSAELIVRSSVDAAPPDDFDEYFGCFKQHELWNEGGVNAVRKLRDEW